MERKQRIITEILLAVLIAIQPLNLFSQTGSISFSGRSLDNGRELQLDSILITNLTKNIDTLIYDASEFIFGTATGIDKLPNEVSGLAVSYCYPSLCEDFTRISILSDGSRNIDIGVFGLKGELMASASSDQYNGRQSFKIRTAGLSPGIYLIRVLSEGNVISRRFIKSGTDAGGSCEIINMGSDDSFGPPLKFANSVDSDLYRFIGYSTDCLNDTLDSIYPVDRRKYWFRFTMGMDAGNEPCNSGSIWYDWTCFPMDYLGNWGLGTVEKEYSHNDKDYYWYIDQKYTGPHSGNNCGPSSVTMACMWSDSTFDLTSENARETYRPDGGWWYTNNIVDYLNLHSIPNSIVTFTDSLQIEELIQSEKIIILCLNTAHLRRTFREEDRVDRFYGYADGHFLVVKGVRNVDDHMYFETYDPNNWGMTYYDSSQKGENRHYRAADITEAVKNWWSYLIVVSPTGYDPLKYALEGVVDSHSIEHQKGR